MATDYDAPRVREGEEEKTESLEELRLASAPKADLLEEPDENLDGLELPGADLSAMTLTVAVIPQQDDEFTCTSCFLVHHRSQESSPGVCADCA